MDFQEEFVLALTNCETTSTFKTIWYHVFNDGIPFLDLPTAISYFEL